ncbi:FAD-binding oxidoreductase [Candidatus Pseudothioglobus singularis]|nr:FAD-binding oxidoreductase [Candidatus Pseudothioglobus singularis]
MVYDWIVIGGGISGITTAEILTREGHSVLLLEKNNSLASETSKVFHEWLHTGSLFTLVPDNYLTTRYLLGAIDDLLKYYNQFDRMNLRGTELGLKVSEDGWFNNNNIHFHYRNRRINPIWTTHISRSIKMVNFIKRHDWLRRTAGMNIEISKREILKEFSSIISDSGKFVKVESADLTINSRVLISDILNQAKSNGLEIILNTKVQTLLKEGKKVKVKTSETEYLCKNVVVCTPDLVSKLFKKKIKISYAPIAVVEGIPDETESFVELDFHTKNCINLLTKEGGFGQAGGISIAKKDLVDPYIQYVIKEHKKRNPSLKVIDQYVGLKKEMVSDYQERNYLYHITEQENNIWSLVLGKFTLAFSSAPEFYRRVYKKNPSTCFDEQKDLEQDYRISETSWQEIVTKGA